MITSPDWLTRYRAGARDQVWHELRQLGAAVREPAYLDEARAVCDEMAGRARQNVEVIVERLTDAGYRFHTNDEAQTPVTPWFPPSAQAAEHAAWLEQTFVEVPLTLLAWVRIVGDVWLVGTHPEWPASAGADPLVLEVEGSQYPDSTMRDHFLEEHAMWREWVDEDDSTGPFTLPLAPDRLHKDNVSGGPPYGIVLPDGGADGLFVAGTTTPFVSYLNSAFSNGGFPYDVPSDRAAWRVRSDLAKDLLPL